MEVPVSTSTLRIGMVVGESSGDNLGAPLIVSLKKRFPNAEFSGIGGDAMKAHGFHSLFDMERLSVMGFVDPLKRLPELLKMRRELVRYFIHNQFDLVIGIDAPDFNLGLEKRVRKAGIKTAHYVSPSVWAWRQGRIKGIKKSVDLMLTLFPFEADFYRHHQVPVKFVGHPLADTLYSQQLSASKPVNDSPLLTLMPGSRHSEVERLLPLFLDVAQALLQTHPHVRFAMPAATQDLYELIVRQLSEYPRDVSQRIDVCVGQSHELMNKSDMLLVASGTTTLEIMLSGKPMVVAYKMAGFSYQIAKRLVKIPYISLPNLLANERLVPEFVQDEATPENILPAVKSWLDDPHKSAQVLARFAELSRSLRCNASERAAEALSQLVI